MPFYSGQTPESVECIGKSGANNRSSIGSREAETDSPRTTTSAGGGGANGGAAVAVTGGNGGGGTGAGTNFRGGMGVGKDLGPVAGSPRVQRQPVVQISITSAEDDDELNNRNNNNNNDGGDNGGQSLAR